jgi:hypothetical protein
MQMMFVNPEVQGYCFFDHLIAEPNVLKEFRSIMQYTINVARSTNEACNNFSK